MLINKDTVLTGQRVILIPYRKHHVPKYHEWMKSEELQKLTGSEPLTLAEEYEMQMSWMQDCNKCTFIILDKTKFDQGEDELDTMIGDTNLYMLDVDSTALVAEAEIMIAEAWARGRKCGLEAMLIMLDYGVNVLNIKQFVVKILCDNNISVQMFQNMGFVETSRSAIFNEITFEKVVDDEFKEWLGICTKYEINEIKPS